MQRLHLQTLGRFSLIRDGVELAELPTMKARVLCAFLALHPGTYFTREHLIGRLWPDVDGERGRNSLKSALYSIRRTLRDGGLDADSFLQADPAAVRWIGETEIDCAGFERTAAQDPQAALLLYAGSLLEGAFDDWSLVLRERFESMYETALERALELTRDVRLAQRLLDRNPYSELAWSTLIESDLAARRVHAARLTLERARVALGELSAEIAGAFASRFVLPASEKRLAFVGREAELSRLRNALESDRQGIAVVVGQAGMGKSELLRAFFRSLDPAAAIVNLSPRNGSLSFTRIEALVEAVTGKPPDESVELESLAGRVAEFCRGKLVVIDDAHDLDGDAARFVRALLAEVGKAFLATRPEGASRIDAQRVIETIELGPLPHDATVAALTGRVSLDAGIAEALYERAGGYPLALQALLREIGSARSTDALRSLPHEVRALIDKRLEDAGSRAREVAAVLALEPTLTPEDIARVLGREEEAVLDAFDTLLRYGVLGEVDAPRVLVSRTMSFESSRPRGPPAHANARCTNALRAACSIDRSRARSNGSHSISMRPGTHSRPRALASLRPGKPMPGAGSTTRGGFSNARSNSRRATLARPSKSSISRQAFCSPESIRRSATTNGRWRGSRSSRIACAAATTARAYSRSCGFVPTSQARPTSWKISILQPMKRSRWPASCAIRQRSRAPPSPAPLRP